MSSDTIHGLFIHGVGQQKSDYAHNARRYLRATLLKQDVKSYMRSVWWAPIADKVEKELLESAEKAGLEGNLMQNFSYGTMGDALYYLTSQTFREECWSMLDYEHRMLGDGPVTVFAHSLGCLLTADWLRQRPKVAISRLVTVGCNLKLFSMGQGFDSPWQIGCAGKWINIFDKDDGLCTPLSFDPSLAHVKDMKVKLSGWFSWTGLAHTAYWDCKRLWTRTIPDILYGAGR